MTMTIFESTDGVSPRSAAAYHFSPIDARGRPRAGIEIIGGSPESVLRIAEKLPFQQKIKHSSTSWAPTDQPSNQEIQCRVKDEIRYACAGLNPERIAYYTCVHRRRVNLDEIVDRNSPMRIHLPNDLCRVDTHTVILCVDLLTFSPFNPMPWPTDMGYVHLSEAYDWRYGYARPGDPARMRLFQPSPRKPFVSHLEREGIEVTKTVNDAIGTECEEAVLSGRVADREQMLVYLRKFGTVEIIRDDSITILHTSGVRVRLQGKMYRKDFLPEKILVPKPEEFIADRLRMMAYWNAQAAKVIGSQSKSIHSSSNGIEEDPRVLQSLSYSAFYRSKFEEATNKRAEYNHERYCRKIVVGVRRSLRIAYEESRLEKLYEDDVECSNLNLLKTKLLMPRPDPWLNPPRSRPENIRRITALEGLSLGHKFEAHHSFSILEDGYAGQDRANHIEFASDKIDHVGELCHAARGGIGNLVDEIQRWDVECEQSARNACRSIEQINQDFGAAIASGFERWNVEFIHVSSATCRSVEQRIEAFGRKFNEDIECRNTNMGRDTKRAFERLQYSVGKAGRAIADCVAQSRTFRKLQRSLSASSVNSDSLPSKTGFTPK